MNIKLDWSVGFTESESVCPTKISATVPGAVQLDWAKAEGWGDYYYGDNYKEYQWMEDVYWHYSTKLEFPFLDDDSRLFFVCKGIDYKFKVLLNGREIHSQEGMFTPFEIDLSQIASQRDELGIIVYPAPKREGAPIGRWQADQSCKPAVSYGWDWHPRLIPLGIWDETFIEIRSDCHIQSAEVGYSLSDDLKQAEVFLNTALNQSNGEKLVWKFYDRMGNLTGFKEENVFLQNVQLSMNIENVELWWPNGQGDAVLYNYTVELVDKNGHELDIKKGRVGFRKVQLVMHPGAWDEPSDFPKTRSTPPISLEINGREIFCKGSNWVNPEIFPGIITEDTYRPLIELAKEAHMNILRSWGGGIINKDSFFDLCDEYGIMVWQEFPLACNDYKGTPSYLKILDQESKSIIKRLRSHACIAIWCGGNELFNSWSGMTDQSIALRLLNKNCFELDPHTPFIMTSPLMGMAHGNYLFRYLGGEEVFQMMPKASNTAYTEFGCPGPSPVEYLKSFIPHEELFPPKPGTAWETHHAFGAWLETSWLELKTIEYYFGQSSSLDQLVERGQILQCEGYKCIFEEARRQKPKCSMAINWCYNEPWPTAANNSIVNWPAIKKPSYHAVQASCRPVLTSARISKFVWTENEVFNPELWILNDSSEPVAPGRVEAFLEVGSEEIFLLAWDFPQLQPNTNSMGPIVRYKLPSMEIGMMRLILKVDGEPMMNSYYFLQYTQNGISQNAELVRQLNM